MEIKEKKREMRECLGEIKIAMTKRKYMELIGEFNDLFLFINSVETVRE